METLTRSQPTKDQTWKHFRGSLWRVVAVENNLVTLSNPGGVLPPMSLDLFMGTTTLEDGQTCDRFTLVS